MTRRKTRRRAAQSRSGPKSAAAFGERTDLENPALWIREVALARKTSSGERVDHGSAMGLSTYWACLNDISQDLAKLPLQLRRHRSDSRGSDEERKHPASRLVRRRPNPLMGPMRFRMTLQHRALAWGNGYAEIVRNAAGHPVELWPVHPVRLTPKLGEDGKTLRYEYRPEGKTLVATLEPRDVFHIQGLGNGIEGYSVLRFASESIGLGLAAQRHAGQFYGDGLGKRMVAVAKRTLGPQGRKEFRERLKGDQENDPIGSRKLPFLEGDIDLKDVGIPPEEAQFLETRQYSVPDVARWFRMALAKLQHEGSAKGWNSLESLNRDYATDALNPWDRLWCEELWLKLLTEAEQEEDALFFKHVLQALLVGDSTARKDFYASGIQNGWLSQNDVRELEDMNPIEDPGADEYRVQKQNVALGDTGVEAKPPPAKGTEEQDEEQDEPSEVVQALRPVVLDAASRLVRKEAHALRRAFAQHAGDAEAFATWARDFYARLAATAVEAFAPAFAAATQMGVAVTNPLAAEISKWLAHTDPQWDPAAYCRTVAAGGEAARADALAAVVLAHLAREAEVTCAA